jgi:Zn-finger nucleic acid-binding protein
MICPHCNRSLESVADRDLPVHNCPGCSGTWISGHSLHAMLAKSDDSDSIEQILDSILKLDYRNSRRQCPACVGRYLKIVTIEATELDFCASCKGVFFDPGELERVLPAVTSQGGIPGRSEQSADQGGFWSSLKRMLDAN